MDKNLEQSIKELLDKQEITEVMNRYLRGLDRVDADLIASVYHEDATDDRGPEVSRGGAIKDFVPWCIGVLESLKSTWHQLGNVDIKLDGDKAFCESYFFAYHQIAKETGDVDLIISGRYLDRFEKRDGVWKISHRIEVNDWTREDDSKDGWFSENPGGLRGVRGKGDLSFDHKNFYPNWN